MNRSQLLKKNSINGCKKILCKKQKNIKNDCDSDSDSHNSNDSSDICDNYIRTDLWCKEEPKCSDICVVQKSCSIDANICVQKNLLTVCRVPGAALISSYYTNGMLPNAYAQLVLTYEIVLLNKTNSKIANISLFDSLAGITFENAYTSTVEIIKCPGHITLYEMEEIAARKGLLNNPDGSYLPPNSITTIVLKLAIQAPPNSMCEIRYVCNSIYLEGCIETSACKNNKIIVNRNPINPIIEKSNIWQTDSDFIFLIGLIL